ncbi:MAG: 50S ribosomal protein L28 [Dehalococcoidia bacterium]
MAACALCHKTPGFGYNVSHSKRHTKRTWQPNIQRATIYVDGRPKRVYICTRCLRSQHRIR